jgi:hypothetical protein
MEDKEVYREKLRREGWPESVPISEELLKSLPRGQYEVLYNLKVLAEEEKKLCDEINARRPTQSGIIMESGALTICEDEDDWKVITLGPRAKLERVRQRIKENLEKALDCGLAHLGLIQRQCANHGVKP